ncbi:BtpA protein [Sinorhizobium sp. GW3]|nr:BtpA protein [Sinorhizobium sp. GW3]
MIHCPAFPGAPRYRGADMSVIYDACMRDAEALVEGGLHGLMIENHGDVPFSKPEDIGHETAAFMSVVTDRIARATGVPLGINVLANAPILAFAIAMAGGAKFIRVNQWANAYVANEGFMEGRAAEAMRYRSLLRAEHIKVFADSHVKHGAHAIVADRSIQELTRDLAFFDADGVIATGQRTGNTATIEEIEEIGSATHLPLLVGSGVTKDNIVEILKRTNGVIVASSLKQGGVWWNPVDIERVKAFRAAAEPALEA